MTRRKSLLRRVVTGAGKTMASVRGRITFAATLLVALTLLLASVFLVRLVEADLLEAAQATLGEDLAIETEAFDESFRYIDIPLGNGEVWGLGVFSEFEEDLAIGTVYVNGTPVADLVIDLETEAVVEIVDYNSQLWLDPEEVLVEEAGALAVDGQFDAEMASFEDAAGVAIEGEFDPEIGSFPVADTSWLEDPEIVRQLESLILEVAEVDSDGDGNGETFLVVGSPLQQVENSITAVRQALIVIMPLLVLLFAVLTWWLVGRALRPVHAITDQVQAISTSNLDRRVPVPHAGDEVAELATVMNQMLTRLEIGGERQRQFSADASHELRSPLSTVRAAAELIQLGKNPERSTAMAGEIVAEADRMDALIGDLLELSRLDEDHRPAQRESFDLATLVRTELEDNPVELNTPPVLMIEAAPSQLRRVVRNLVDNAIRHSQDRVLVSVGHDEADAVHLIVEDDGNGVPDGDHELIFERFARLDEARSRDQGGSGLGLALVKAIVDHHGGTIAVDRSELGGARFVVGLPKG